MHALPRPPPATEVRSTLGAQHARYAGHATCRACSTSDAWSSARITCRYDARRSYTASHLLTLIHNNTSAHSRDEQARCRPMRAAEPHFKLRQAFRAFRSCSAHSLLCVLAPQRASTQRCTRVSASHCTLPACQQAARRSWASHNTQRLLSGRNVLRRLLHGIACARVRQAQRVPHAYWRRTSPWCCALDAPSQMWTV